MRAPRLGIRARLTLLTLALLTPMAAIAIWHFSEEREDSRSRAEERTRDVARLIASRADEFVRRTEVSLEAAALMMRVDPPDMRYNDSILTALSDRTVGTNGTLEVHAVGGGNIGASHPPPGARRNFSIDDRRYYSEALHTAAFAIGEPVHSRPDSTRWMVGFGLPIRGRSGNFVAVVHASYLLDSLRYVADAGTLPPGSVVQVVDSGGRMVFSSIDPKKAVGHDVSSLASFHLITSAPHGVMTSASELDGVNRIRAWERVTHAPWFVVVGIASSEAMAQQSARSRHARGAVARSRVLARLVAAVVAARISRPIIALTADAQAIAGGRPRAARRGDEHE